MEVAEILECARSRDIILTAERGWIAARPKGATPPDLAVAIRRHKAELLAYLTQGREDLEIDRLAEADGWKPLPQAGAPAYSIVQTSQRHGVALRIDDDGDLVVSRAGAKADEPTQRALLAEIEVNLEAVARLVESGWHLRADFPRGVAA